MTDDLASALAALPGKPPARKGPPCGTATVLARLAAEDAGAAGELAAVIDNADVTAAAIARTLSAHGHPVKDAQVLRHRNRSTSTGCACPR